MTDTNKSNPDSRKVSSMTERNLTIKEDVEHAPYDLRIEGTKHSALGFKLSNTSEEMS